MKKIISIPKTGWVMGVILMFCSFAAQSQTTLYWRGAASTASLNSSTDFNAANWATNPSGAATLVVPGTGNDLIVNTPLTNVSTSINLSAALNCNNLQVNISGLAVTAVGIGTQISTNGFPLTVTNTLGVNNTSVCNGTSTNTIFIVNFLFNSNVTVGNVLLQGNQTTYNTAMSTQVALDIGGGSSTPVFTCNGNFTSIDNAINLANPVGTLLSLETFVSGKLIINGDTNLYSTNTLGNGQKTGNFIVAENGGTITFNGNTNIGATSGSANRAYIGGATVVIRGVGGYYNNNFTTTTSGIINFNKNFNFNTNASVLAQIATTNFNGGTAGSPNTISLNSTVAALPISIFGNINFGTSAPGYFNLTGTNPVAVQSGKNLTIGAGTYVDMGTEVFTSLGGGSTLGIGAGGTLRLDGTNNFPASFTTNTLNATSTVDYYALGNQSVSAQQYGHLTYSGSGIKSQLGNIQIAGNFHIISPATGENTNNIATTTYNASLAQDFSVMPYYDLTFNNTGSSGGPISYYVAGQPTVSHTGTFTLGILDNRSAGASNALTFLTAATIAGTPSQSSFVNGYVSKTGTAAFSFPVGDNTAASGTRYHPLAISAPSSSTTVTSSYNASTTPNSSNLGINITAIDPSSYWTFSSTTSGATATVTVTSRDLTTVFPATNLGLAGYRISTGTWERISSFIATPSGNNQTFSSTVIDLSLYSAFAVAAVITPYPGGVSTNLQRWYKADAGVTQATGASAWADQSGNNITLSQATTANQPAYSTTSNLINFNPTLGFDGTNDLINNPTGSIASLGSTGYTFYYVASNTTPAASRQAIALGATNSIDGFNTGSGSTATTKQSGGSVFASQTLQWSAGIPNLTRTGFNGGASQPYYLSTNSNTETLSTNVTPNVTATPFTIGARADGAANFWNGNIAEVILYTGKHTTTSYDEIESYLALKYGLSKARNYLSTDGTLIYTVGTYSNNITGIGRDDLTGLHQRISKSVESGSVLTISTDSNFTTANTSSNHTNIASNKNFLVMGNNGLAYNTTSNITIAGQTFAILNKIWNAQDTGNMKCVNLSFDMTGAATLAGGQKWYVILADDAAFTTNVKFKQIDPVSGSIQTSLTFNANSSSNYITLAQSAPLVQGAILPFEDVAISIQDDLPTGATNTYLDIYARNQGVVVSRISGTASITTPVEGMLIFDTTDSKFKVYNGSSWRILKDFQASTFCN